MGCCSDFLLKIIQIILRLIETGIAIAIIIIVAVHLTDHTVTAPDGSVSFEFSCLLGNTQQQVEGDSSTNYCAYAYAVAGISMAACLAMSILLCVTCDLCGGGVIIELIITCALTVWWIVAACIFSKQAADTNDYGDWISDVWDDLTDTSEWSWSMSQKSWRNSVAVLSWVAALLFFIEFIICCSRLLCGCCGSSDKADLKKEKKAREKAEKEAAQLRAQQGQGTKEAVPV